MKDMTPIEIAAVALSEMEKEDDGCVLLGYQAEIKAHTISAENAEAQAKIEPDAFKKANLLYSAELNRRQAKSRQQSMYGYLVGRFNWTCFL